MEFFPYKPVSVPNLKDERTRFKSIVFLNPTQGAPGVNLWPQRATVYADGRETLDELPTISQTMADPAILGQSFPLYHPETGAEIGTMTFGELAGIIYSAAIAIDQRNDAERQAANAEPPIQ